MLGAQQFGTVTTETDGGDTVFGRELDEIGGEGERHRVPASPQFAGKQDAGLGIAPAPGEGQQCTHRQPALSAADAASATGAAAAGAARVVTA
ncbi:hypothetical protein GCM10011610_28360 [Nocardia rhizosphaerihabitans]|uniref:Uncharacterized protein n=1 Tax=Nocardia rhizosphaerihabitans TaxID=1691570 RepID=A0ABQ2KFT1_9NOCA|nr:hypothetical protein GCM10011610_28360 [Nocardia rhizosphaerihabitans]